ncbi:KpsF/GutQ family sugar-phosphate isomerase [Algibacillus agarilyticus]|uniref:KpsF/GutQ family sugar-phosphate isomerase n=1 Tax=Algibacillus agarilyticus TaxID=2234133 RepID=UPI000DD06DAE|nr:KpsF/GutQ family sugar-phosphate isomerase [Algibacillus agarilyticus]
MTSLAKKSYLATAKRVLNLEIDALSNLFQYLDHSFEQACDELLNCKGKVIVLGMGKSGHIAKKVAATLASTGTPAFFVHPAEASHGDLGMIGGADCVFMLSNSGETDEIVKLLPVIKRIGTPIISMTSNPKSTLANESLIHITCAVQAEACPLGLAPTSSTTAALVLGDALAVALLEAREFTENDFALSHPAGSLGRRLLLRVEDLMHMNDELPIAKHTLTIAEALLIITEKRMGFTAVVNQNKALIGVFTDGDLRRAIDNRIDLHSTQLKDIVKSGCTVVKPTLLAAEALKIMEDKAINGLIITDEHNTPVGALNMHDLLRAKVL